MTILFLNSSHLNDYYIKKVSTKSQNQKNVSDLGLALLFLCTLFLHVIIIIIITTNEYNIIAIIIYVQLNSQLINIFSNLFKFVLKFKLVKY